MKTQHPYQPLLTRVQRLIRDIDGQIKQAELAMRKAPLLPLLDLEELRVLLWQLRRGEQMLVKRMAETSSAK